MNKGQSAIEFLILVGGIVFFFIVFISAVQINISDKVREQRDLLTREIALTIKDEIELAHNSVDGYFREFELPQTIAGRDYNVTINGDLVYVVTEDGRHAAAFSVLDIILGDEITSGKNSIMKDEGVVCVNFEFDECGDSEGQGDGDGEDD